MHTLDTAWLDADGYLVFPRLISPARVRTLLDQVEALFAEENASSGARKETGTRHLASLLARTPEFAALAEEPLIVAAARHVLGTDSLARDVDYRAPLPGFGGQALHADWAGPVEPGAYCVANAFVALVDYTEAIGATRVVPGSHRSRKVPRGAQPGQRYPGEKLLLGPAGTVFFANGHLWHSGTRNDAAIPRHSLRVVFARQGLPQLDY